MLVSLKNSEIFNLTLPAKVQAYMSSGKPIIAMLNGEGQRVIDESGCGLHCDASDSQGLTELIVRMKSMDRNAYEEMGKRGKEYSDRYFNLNRCIDNLESVLSKQ